jgi:ech hydrogenase subunit C
MTATSQSPWLLHYDASSCNGCDIEVLACLTPLYDVERFGIINTGNPKHADLFVVTGCVNERNIEVVRQLYLQMPEPKVVLACGACACTGGIFRECYNTLGGINKAIPVDVYVPGCAVRPESIIDGVVASLGILEERRAALKENRLQYRPLPADVSVAGKLVGDVTVLDALLAEAKAQGQAANPS